MIRKTDESSYFNHIGEGYTMFYNEENKTWWLETTDEPVWRSGDYDANNLNDALGYAFEFLSFFTESFKYSEKWQKPVNSQMKIICQYETFFTYNHAGKFCFSDEYPPAVIKKLNRAVVENSFNED